MLITERKETKYRKKQRQMKRVACTFWRNTQWQLMQN